MCLHDCTLIPCSCVCDFAILVLLSVFMSMSMSMYVRGDVICGQMLLSCTPLGPLFGPLMKKKLCCCSHIYICVSHSEESKHLCPISNSGRLGQWTPGSLCPKPGAIRSWSGVPRLDGDHVVGNPEGWLAALLPDAHAPRCESRLP